ncbi:MAG: glycoside hydrolase family 32 protein, partial [Anaerolineae bacterium]
SDDTEEAYYVRLEPSRNRIVFDSWPRRGDLPHMVELERPLALRPEQPVELQVLLDGTICEVCVGREIAMSTRLYNLRHANWGVFVQEGSAHFRNAYAAVRGMPA